MPCSFLPSRPSWRSRGSGSRTSSSAPHTAGPGPARALISAVAARLLERGGDRLEWSALKWNELALGFYRGLGAQRMDEWVTHRLIGEDLRTLAATRRACRPEPPAVAFLPPGLTAGLPS